MSEPVRFIDVLTTASAVANYLGHPTVTAEHMAAALAVLLGEQSMEDLGPPVSPMARRTGPAAEVAPDVRDLVRRWFDALGNDPSATLNETQVEELRAQLRALAEAS